MKNERISISISDKKIDKISKSGSYILQYKYNDVYNVLVIFDKNIYGEFSLSITILNTINKTEIDENISEKGSLYSFFDKVFDMEFESDNTVFFIRLDIEGDTVEQFIFSRNISKQIKTYGNINLYNHIIYTNFQDDIELVKLCYKYSCFYNQIFR